MVVNPKWSLLLDAVHKDPMPLGIQISLTFQLQTTQLMVVGVYWPSKADKTEVSDGKLHNMVLQYIKSNNIKLTVSEQVKKITMNPIKNFLEKQVEFD